jgi:hypothetical protein
VVEAVLADAGVQRLSSLASVLQPGSCTLVGRLVKDLYGVNARLWDAEDLTRDVRDDSSVAAVKRSIDRLNLERNVLIEQIDGVLSLDLKTDTRTAATADTPMHTETIGSVIDRLTILALRLTHTRTASADDPSLAERVAHLELQYTGLEDALAALIHEVSSGMRQLPDGRRFKLYGTQHMEPRH